MNGKVQLSLIVSCSLIFLRKNCLKNILFWLGVPGWLSPSNVQSLMSVQVLIRIVSLSPRPAWYLLKNFVCV